MQCGIVRFERNETTVIFAVFLVVYKLVCNIYNKHSYLKTEKITRNSYFSAILFSYFCFSLEKYAIILLKINTFKMFLKVK